MTDVMLTAIVRRARCVRCDGKGFRLVPVPIQERMGEWVSGDRYKQDCPDCDGDGILLKECRRLAASPDSLGIIPRA